MKGDAQPLIKFFDGADKRFIIPLYQRNYDRTTGRFLDLLKMAESITDSRIYGFTDIRPK